jgi:hypothetical protein
MPPKKRKQDDSDADGDDVKLEPVIDHARSAIEHISHCTMEELRLVFEAARRRQDRLSLLAANRFEPGDTVTWKGQIRSSDDRNSREDQPEDHRSQDPRTSPGPVDGGRDVAEKS